LAKYCEQRELGDSNNYKLIFDGDTIDLKETSISLDLDGEEIFDVKKKN
jgi:hypothetical protein